MLNFFFSHPPKHASNLQLRWLKQVARVKDDGTIAVEVPGDIKPECLAFGTKYSNGQVDNEEYGEETHVQDIRPLQIVMLIVGTRGDVQPFVAIGKRLQVFCLNNFSSNSLRVMIVCLTICV